MTHSQAVALLKNATGTVQLQVKGVVSIAEPTHLPRGRAAFLTYRNAAILSP